MTDEEKARLDAHLAEVIRNSIEARAILRSGAPTKAPEWAAAKATAESDAETKKRATALAANECPKCGGELHRMDGGRVCVPCQEEYPA